MSTVPPSLYLVLIENSTGCVDGGLEQPEKESLIVVLANIAELIF